MDLTSLTAMMVIVLVLRLIIELEHIDEDTKGL